MGPIMKNKFIEPSSLHEKQQSKKPAGPVRRTGGRKPAGPSGFLAVPACMAAGNHMGSAAVPKPAQVLSLLTVLLGLDGIEPPTNSV